MATQLEVAAKLGISDRWLRKLVEIGAVKDRGRKDWDALDAARQLLAYEKGEVERLKAENASLKGQLQRGEGEGANKATADARRMEALADKAEIETAEMKGLLVPVDQIADALHGAVVIMKMRLGAIPAKAAPLAHAAPSVAVAESILRGEVDEALSELGKVVIASDAAAA